MFTLNRVRVAVAVVVVAIWVASIIYRSVRPGFGGDFVSVDTSVALVLGYLFLTNSASPPRRLP